VPKFATFPPVSETTPVPVPELTGGNTKHSTIEGIPEGFTGLIAPTNERTTNTGLARVAIALLKSVRNTYVPSGIAPGTVEEPVTT
jgi:hypothetical protein